MAEKGVLLTDQSAASSALSNKLGRSTIPYGGNELVVPTHSENGGVNHTTEARAVSFPSNVHRRTAFRGGMAARRRRLRKFSGSRQVSMTVTKSSGKCGTWCRKPEQKRTFAHLRTAAYIRTPTDCTARSGSCAATASIFRRSVDHAA